jgi:hypothetical protein
VSGARRALAAAVLAAGALAGIGLATGSEGAGDGGAGGAEGGTLPAPPRPALAIGRPEGLAERDVAQWAPVRRAVVARAAPRASAPAVARLDRTTPEETENLVLVEGRERDADGGLWVRARLPVLPNGTTGWVPRAALGGLQTVRTRLVVDLSDLRATLLRDGRPVLRAPVGVGTPDAPTPTGRFYVRNRLTRFASPAYGPVAFGTSARSATLTDWPAGGYVGIHGTDRPDLLPGRVSHGCIRMRNADVLRLERLMPVGTPLTVRA